jgi:uncharacterized lipoprotein
MNFVLRVLICLLPLALVSCSYINKSSFSQNKDKTYLYAKSIPPLRTPPGIANSSFHAAYPVSDRNYPIAAEDVSVVPPGLYSNA